MTPDESEGSGNNPIYHLKGTKGYLLKLTGSVATGHQILHSVCTFGVYHLKGRR